MSFESFSSYLAEKEGLQITGALDGFAVRWGGEVVDVFPSLMGAIAGRFIAQNALHLLNETLKGRK